MRKYLAGFFTCYFFCGFMIGLTLKTAVPATNMIGVSYIAIIWPWWVSAPVLGIEPPVPSQSFTFHDS